MAAKPVTVGDKHFPTKGTLTKYCQEVRDRYQYLNNKVVTDPDDDAFLRALLALHSEADQKMRPGVDYFEVRKHPDWDTYGFWVVRTDGTEDDFSYPDIIRKL
ncbi:DCL family protein [Streptomyces sp. BK205]|uniref:DCL family protein n=1 Tax=Streptomyces sp. BK205 TaxID=2512164 RepID=UPI00104B784E|nr:DCL family protein [Streptomyces sp. BK205]TCR24193.1 uncharacterized protein DUF3223 [Streptomyces sp. BK205]